VDKNPNATRALLMAVMEAQQWCDKMENKQEMSTIVGRRQWFNVPVADIVGRARGDINYGRGRVEKGTKQFMKFWQDHASYPFKSHDAWFVTEDIRWGKFDQGTDINGLVNKVNREDLWREAAKSLSVAAADIPATSSRGKETFFDGKVFDPADPAGYLKSLSIKRIEV
jgi:nitrate/nitrite transport system substrate-binding protein